MKTIGSINLEYRQVMNQADKLGDCADDLRKIQKQLDSLVQSLRSGWAGESAELYYQKCQELGGKITQSGQNLDRIAGVIQKSAKAYRKAELASLEAVRNS